MNTSNLVLESEDIIYLDGIYFDDLIETLKNFKAQYPNASYFSVEKKNVPYEDYEEVYMQAWRPETEKETAQRIEKENEWKKRQEERDRLEYEKLKKKFEGGK